MSWGSNNYQAGLQAVLAASSAIPPSLPDGGQRIDPHHPIACHESKMLLYHEDGSMECEHTVAPADNTRNQTVLNHSVAILLIEMLHVREGTAEPPSEKD